MYAVIAAAGKQYRVAEGQQIEVDRIAREGDDLTFTPVLLVDGDTVLSTPDELSSATVTARVVGELRGRKINGFDYKNKSNQRKRWGHRQELAAVEIVSITKG